MHFQVIAEAAHKRSVIEATAIADAAAMKGDAEAFAITAVATAEAEGMTMKAEAFREYKKAAKVAMWMEALPSMAAEVSAPLSQCEKVIRRSLTIITILQVTMMIDLNADPSKGSSGPAKLTDEVMNIMCRYFLCIVLCIYVMGCIYLYVKPRKSPFSW